MNVKYSAGFAAALAALTLSPAHAQDHGSRRAHSASVQNNKNNMRNLAIGGAAIAGYGLLTHNSTATLLGAGGAALAGNSYENARHEQSRNSSRRYHRRYR